MNVQDITGGSTWAIAAAAFSNPMYLSGPLGKSDNSNSTGFQITPGAALVVGFEGTYAGSTVAHEQTMDPDGVVGWFSVEGSPSTGAAATSTGSTSGVAYVFTCIGVLHRVKVTALSSGTIEVRIRLESEAISTSGGGGGGGAAGGTVTATAAAPTYVEGSSDNPVSSDLHGSQRATILDASGAAVDWTAPVAVNGPTAADAALTVAPVTGGGLAKTANPAAVADGDVVNALHDKLGKQVVVGAVRELSSYAPMVTITSSTTRTAIIAAGAAGVFNDLLALVIANTSATDTDVLIEDGTVDVMTISIKAGATAGFTGPGGVAWPQAAAATAWNATCADSVASIVVGALFVKNT